ncbi:hypothetical protein GWI33_017135 [Rhynchophorus ferrugineus]|uniref:Uncharacterized protein n=1 Tax=Rhynchophorus ferrugineus TaxID=354439 RepID=A0A834I0C2_RHYFE|nr:hypothetical protein GWI33_017135 [Rhynchophorus ferrugineus]
MFRPAIIICCSRAERIQKNPTNVLVNGGFHSYPNEKRINTATHLFRNESRRFFQRPGSWTRLIRLMDRVGARFAESNFCNSSNAVDSFGKQRDSHCAVPGIYVSSRFLVSLNRFIN